MPKVSKRHRQPTSKNRVKRYRTCIYKRLSEKDGGHGREDSIIVQEQICKDFMEKHPELLYAKTYCDNGVSGTNFSRRAFEELMTEVKKGNVDCIIVKDFARFGRDAIEAVDLIDVIFPTMGIRFISVLDDYDSENPACVNDRVKNILKHFMNDYYAKEVSKKLIQAHKLSRKKGEYWGNRPPYGYKWSEESKKILIPDDDERKIVQRIYQSCVIDGKKTMDIAKELNDAEIPSPQESHEIRQYGKRKKEQRILWSANFIGQLLQNPVYIGAAVYGKTVKMLFKNIPVKLIPREEWEIIPGVREPLIEETLYDMACTIIKDRWKCSLAIFEKKSEDREYRENAKIFVGKVICASCGKRMFISGTSKKAKVPFYKCVTTRVSDHICKLSYVPENIIRTAVQAALEYQIKLAVDFGKKYGNVQYNQLKHELDWEIEKARVRYESYQGKLDQLFEHYLAEILGREEFAHLRDKYTEEQKAAGQVLLQTENRSTEILNSLRTKMEWAEMLLKCQGMDNMNRGAVESFIESIIVETKEKITVNFWFDNLFCREESEVGTHEE